MGHKINPKGFRLGTIFTWDSRWFAGDGQYKQFVLEDAIVRKILEKRLHAAGLTQTEIERSINKMSVTLHVVRPGTIIGRGGQGMEELKKHLQSYIIAHREKQGIKQDKKQPLKLEIRVEPVKEPNLSAQFMASQIADQLAKRLPHKRVVNCTMEKIMNSGARGAKIMVAGRIAGAESSRKETYNHGRSQ